MTNFFRPDPDRSIVSAWIDQGFDIDIHEIKGAIEYEQSAEKLDKNIGFSAVASGAGLMAVTLTLTGFTPFLLPSLALAAWGGLMGYNSAINARRRELEEDFLTEFPSILKMVESKLTQGEPDSRVASAFDAAFREYRKGNDEAISGMISGTQSPAAQLPPQQPTQLEQPAPYIASPPQDQDAPTQQQAESLAPSGSQQAVARPSQQSPIAFLADDPKSQMVIGVTGGGKDFLMSNALRLLLQKYPSFSVLVMDGKGDPKEAGYYAGLPGVTVRSLRILESTPEDATEWINACIDEFQGLTAPKLLVINEGTAIRGFPSKYPDFAVHVASGGDSSAIYCWEAGQIAHTSALKIDGGRRSLFAPIALISKRRPDQVDALLATGFTPKELKTQAFEAMDSSPVGRAWFDGRRWQPMPRLENFSGYDRDDLAQKFAKREPTGKTKPTSQVEQLERLYRETPSLDPMEVEDSPIVPDGDGADPVEDAIVKYIQKRGDKGAQVRDLIASKSPAFSGLNSDDLRFYLSVLEEEGKLSSDGTRWYFT